MLYMYMVPKYICIFLVPCWLLFETRRPREKKFGGLGNMMRYKLLLEFGFKDQVINSEGLNKVLYQSIYAMIELGQN